MVPFDLLLQHMAALVAVWAVVLLPGVPMNALLRSRLGFPGCALLGLVYWAVSLYVFRFDGGLDVALGLAGAACLVGAWRGRAELNLARLRRPEYRWACAILVVGCAIYATLQIRNYVPMGVDAGMVGASARVIAARGALPADYAPWFPDLFFPAVNLALPTIGGVAARLGCEPASVTLALAQLAYSVWILGAYLVLRLWARPPAAAVLAVAQAWGARWAQNTIGWGGFPTVAGVAVGLLALRLLWDAHRRGTLRSAVALGLAAGALPLVHGVSAGVWVYAIAPVAAAAALISSPHRARTALTLGGAVCVAGVVLGCYLLAGQVHMSGAEIDWSRDHLRGDAPHTGAWPEVVPVALDYLKRYSGSAVAWVGLAGWLILVALGRWRAALALAGCLALLVVLLANAHWWVLPFSMMLYPNRIVYWAGPLAALAVALAWRAAGKRFPALGMSHVGMGAGVALLALTFVHHFNQYQRGAWNPPVGRDGWEALCWARMHLKAPGTFVEATYGQVGTFLPVCANVATSAWQIHHCAMDEKQAVMDRQRPTHRLSVRGVDPCPTPRERILFENATVTIVAVPAEDAQRASNSVTQR